MNEQFSYFILGSILSFLECFLIIVNLFHLTPFFRRKALAYSVCVPLCMELQEVCVVIYDIRAAVRKELIIIRIVIGSEVDSLGETKWVVSSCTN